MRLNLSSSKLVTSLIVNLLFYEIVVCVCPVEDDPTNLARCIQIDVSAIVALAKGSNDFTSFCALADRYMECIKTYTRGCIGYYVIFLNNNQSLH